ncbi:hypothetical protein Aab01nite_42390 [Paractinoplanes abujensis]|uniref:Uncharacterized protein n=1 Tax=Paractinoplanes abujensis TaxID=882441 RepID=A0A7W7CSY9_9ACTN|nr:hypothetical protein [Actinoplanes abujensis]MBB4694137.1 hypothetical protein [Actinoplanes abujensis]GID20649.1 hypothetical protein Aab01nite_42390 [Actinoplanes abujensis]
MRSRGLRAILIVGLVLAGLSLANTAWSAFRGGTANSGNQYAAGSVILTDNSGGQTMFTVTALRPGVAPSRCIRVTYEGTLPSTIKMVGATTGGTGLENYLMLSVTRGSGVTGSFPGCTGFTPDATDYNSLGPGVLYSGTVATYPAAGLTDPKLNWATNEAHWYQLSVDVLDSAAALGQTVTHTFSWDAR